MRPYDDNDTLLIGATLTAAGLAAATWLGAHLALLVAGHPRLVPPSAVPDAMVGLLRQPAIPSDAWSAPVATHLPGPAAYWACTATAGMAVLILTVWVARHLNRRRVGSRPRRPLGVHSHATFARRRDLRPLLIRSEQPGRFVIGRLGRSLIATEPPRNRTPGQRRQRSRADCGAIALIGPSRSGKSVTAIGGILQWDGPAVISSVKADLLASTRTWRRTIGDVRIYDPTGTTIDPAQSARWSPLQHAHTTLGAQRAARALCDAGHHGGPDAALDYWLAQAQILLSGILYVAAAVGRDMSTVADWILLQDRPTQASIGQVQSELDQLHESPHVTIRDGAEAARKALAAIWNLDDRARSGAYSTAQTLIWPWTEPTVAASSTRDPEVAPTDLAWLHAGANTLYLCSPIEDQHRLAPAIGGLLNDILNQAYRHVARTGLPLDPPLLVVIDEAGNTPLRALPEYASTLAGIGIVLVTVWQSIAQLEARYQRQADTILTNHLSKVFFPGLADLSSTKYIDGVLGQTEVPSISRSTQSRTTPTSVQETTNHQPLTPPHTLRQMSSGTALLVHGTLRPAHIQVTPFHQQRALRLRTEAAVTRSATDS